MWFSAVSAVIIKVEQVILSFNYYYNNYQDIIFILSIICKAHFLYKLII